MSNWYWESNRRKVDKVMCKYCKTNIELHADVLGGKDFSETQGGEMGIEKVNGFYYIAAISWQGDAIESLSINYCPMCGRKFN